MACNSILRIPRSLEESSLPLSYWLLHGVTPHPDSESWIRRLLSLQESQSAVEKMIARFDLSDGSGVSPAFAEMCNDMVFLSATESLPSKTEIEADVRFSLYCDVGLMTRIFATEIGLKCLLSLSGQEVPKRHRLKQLLDLLPSAVEYELERAFGIATQRPDVPDGVVLCPSASAVVELYDDLYMELRYLKPQQEGGAIASAWHNLGAVLHASSLAVVSHEFCRGLWFVPRATME